MASERTPAAGPWQTTEPGDGAVYVFKQVKTSGTILFHVGWRFDDKSWNSMGLGPIRTYRIVAWALLNPGKEVPDGDD